MWIFSGEASVTGGRKAGFSGSGGTGAGRQDRAARGSATIGTAPVALSRAEQHFFRAKKTRCTVARDKSIFYIKVENGKARHDWRTLLPCPVRYKARTQGGECRNTCGEDGGEGLLEGAEFFPYDSH